MATKRTKITVILDGQPNSRTSATMAYTHVVVGRPDVGGRLASALAKVPSKNDRSNFNWYSQIAAQTPGMPWVPSEWSRATTHTSEEIAEAAAKVEGGFDAYFGRVKAAVVCQAQAAHDAEAAKGFPRTVISWSQREDSARKGMSGWRTDGYLDLGVIAIADLPTA